MSELRVTSVEVKDVLGAQELRIVPGQVTIIEGRNGTGKSSALQAVQAAIGGGALARLARVDPSGEPTEPEVVLVLQGPGNETYRVERTGDKVRVRSRVGDTAGFEDVPRPQSWLSSIYDGGCANPVRFLTAADKERALMLLEALPLKFNRAALLREMGVTAEGVGQIPEGLHPLQEIALIRDAVFRQRTGVNRDLKGKEQAAEQTRRNAPAVVPEDAAPKLAQQEALVQALAVDVRSLQERAAAEEREELAAIQTALDVHATRTKNARDTEIAAHRAAYEKRAAEIRAEAERKVDAERRAAEETLAEARHGAEILIEKQQAEAGRMTLAATTKREEQRGIIAKRQATLDAARAELAELNAKAKEATTARALHGQAAQFEQEAVALARDSDRLTAALTALDEHRRRLAEDLPIPGLQIDGPEITVHGVPFEQLNTAQRVAIAVKVATVRAQGRPLPVVFVDGAEGLDEEHFGLLVSELEKNGIQAFVARVTEGDFAVRTEGP